MNPILNYILPAMLPAVIDGVRGLFARVTKGAGGTPQNVDERIRLMQAETEKLKALAELDKPVGEPSQWVVDYRAIFRYAIVTLIILSAILGAFAGVSEGILLVLLDMAGAAMSFIIGERMFISLRK